MARGRAVGIRVAHPGVGPRHSPPCAGGYAGSNPPGHGGAYAEQAVRPPDTRRVLHRRPADRSPRLRRPGPLGATPTPTPTPTSAAVTPAPAKRRERRRRRTSRSRRRRRPSGSAGPAARRLSRRAPCAQDAWMAPEAVRPAALAAEELLAEYDAFVPQAATITAFHLDLGAESGRLGRPAALAEGRALAGAADNTAPPPGGRRGGRGAGQGDSAGGNRGTTRPRVPPCAPCGRRASRRTSRPPRPGRP
jgi:hypothetical protein